MSIVVDPTTVVVHMNDDVRAIGQLACHSCACLGFAVSRLLVSTAALISTLALIDLPARLSDALETIEMVYAVATLMEALLTKANLSEISRLAVLGRIVMREVGGQTWGKDAQTRNALFSASVERGLDTGCGFSTDDWFEAGEATVAANVAANVVPLFVPGDVRVGLEEELQLLVGEEDDAQRKLDSASDALEVARRAQEKAWDEAQEAEMRRVVVTNELFVAQNKRRRTGER